MALLNYTTKVSVESTVDEITRRLRAFGVRELTVRYADKGRPIGLVFRLDTTFAGEQGFVLPADPKPVLQTLERQWSAGQIRHNYVNEEQAERIAWRIVKDWVEAQLAIVETGMVKLETVFLPYMLIAGGETTVYGAASGGHLALPGVETKRALPPHVRVVEG